MRLFPNVLSAVSNNKGTMQYVFLVDSVMILIILFDQYEWTAQFPPSFPSPLVFMESPRHISLFDRVPPWWAAADVYLLCLFHAVLSGQSHGCLMSDQPGENLSRSMSRFHTQWMFCHHLLGRENYKILLLTKWSQLSSSGVQLDFFCLTHSLVQFQVTDDFFCPIIL